MFDHFYKKIDGFSQYDDQGLLLETLLTKLTQKDIRIAEIGVYKGRCTAMWGVIVSNWLTNSKEACEYHGIDTFDGSKEHAKNVDYFGITMNNLQPLVTRQLHPKLDVRIIKNDSVHQASSYPDNYFDIVYIDASHEYKDVVADIKAWTKKVKVGGFLCGDDYVKGWEGVIRAVDLFVRSSQKFRDFTKVGNQQWFVRRVIPEKKKLVVNSSSTKQICIGDSMDDINLEELQKYLRWAPNDQYKHITQPAGIEHYKLLSHIARQLHGGSVVIDLGTSIGSNALSMAYENHTIKVITYDFENRFPKNQLTMLNMSNIEFVHKNGVEFVEKFLDSPMILLDIEPHDGLQEEIFIERLSEAGYRGIVVCNDIHDNINMEYFWENVEQKKIDATRFGHWCGTGIIVFDPAYMDVIMD